MRAGLVGGYQLKRRHQRRVGRAFASPLSAGFVSPIAPNFSCRAEATGRCRLLLGTALASTLLACGVLVPRPAQAQSIIETQANTRGDTQHKTNSNKLTTTLDTIILNVEPALDNSYSASNGLAASQLIDLTQRNSLASDIVITNSGFIDPLIGISSVITNGVGSFSNNAAMSNAFGGSAVDVSQELKLTQSNIVASEITKNNSGNITADLIGIFAEINNLPIGSLANNVVASNATGAATPISFGDITQSADFIQTNTIGSDITIVNSGVLAAATGIEALINTDFDGSLANSAAISNANGGAAAITLLDLTQSIDLVQANAIGGSIEIHNYGATTGAETGLAAQINNQTIGSLANNADLSNVNGATAAVNFADLSQPMKLQQSNEISGDISLYNYGQIGNGNFGINAEIYNRSIGIMANNAPLILAPLSNANGAVEAISLTDLDQTLDLDQANTIDSGISIYNHGEIGSGIGINASVESQYFGGLSNSVAAVNANGQVAAVTADDAVQTFDLGQENLVESQIVIANYSGVNSGSFGIHATILTSDIDALSNSVYVENLNGMAAAVTLGSLEQSANIAQYNTVFSQIIINDAAATDAQTGIQAEVGSQNLNLVNQSEVNAINADVTSINDDDLVQSADIVQQNQVTNDISVQNGGSLTASGTGIRARIDNDGLQLSNTAFFSFLSDASEVAGDVTQTATLQQSNIVSSTITVINTGSVHAGDVGISAEIRNYSLSLSNEADGTIGSAGGVVGATSQAATVTQLNEVESKIAVNNSGSIFGANRGISASISQTAPSFTNEAIVDEASLNAKSIVDSAISIDNAGSIGAGNLFAIETDGASTTVTNRAAGVITGFVDLSDEDDLFDNQAGGTFEARLSSDFGGGDDLFTNEGIVHAVASGGTQPSFVNLERFENSGVISTVNGSVGDIFTLSGPGFEFDANSGSTLAVDAFLGKPGSTADNLVINGNVSGQTELTVNNTNPRGGAYNKQGIPVVFVNGNVNKDSFFLPKPIDAGFVDYDLFFVPTGSGYFELRSLPGGGAQHLPHLVTAVQDVFHIGTETWFDRTADLRVLLNGGVPSDGGEGGKLSERAPQVSPSLTPATWIKGSGTWLNQDDKASTSAYGRTYRYDLSRALDVWNLEGGIDFGKKGVLAERDALIFGVLGGWVQGGLDYDHILRQYDMQGGEAGAYGTYLNGGLFVDTLFKTTFLEIDPNSSPGFSGSFDAMAWGVRTDTGYRFGGFRGGPFIEPLGTIAVVWSALDNLTIDDNKISFDEGTNVRGRLGLRAGLSYDIWSGIRMEPFVIGSVWSNLSGENKATLTSLDTTFVDFTDTPDRLWGVVSAGVNFFSPSASTSLFAKLDVTFGEETNGIGAKAGARVSW